MNPEAETPATELAGMKCIICGGTGDAKSGGWSCLACDGTGSCFPASVRVPCNYCNATGFTHEPFAGRGQGGQNDLNAKYLCEGCDGRGWTASLNSRVWERALQAAGYRVAVNWYPAGDESPASFDVSVFPWHYTKAADERFEKAERLLTALMEEGKPKP